MWQCKQVVCHLCSAIVEDKEHCLPRYLLQSVLPDAKSVTGVDTSRSISSMRTELKNKFYFDHANDLTIEEVEDVWEAYSINRKLEQQTDSIQFPLLPISAIDDSKQWFEIAQIDFNFGGSFLADPDLDEQHLPAVLDLFAALVRFGARDKKYTRWKVDGPVYQAIPEMFIDFSKDCRVDLGYRLLRRTLRHGFDSKCESIDKKLQRS